MFLYTEIVKKDERRKRDKKKSEGEIRPDKLIRRKNRKDQRQLGEKQLTT